MEWDGSVEWSEIKWDGSFVFTLHAAPTSATAQHEWQTVTSLNNMIIKLKQSLIKACFYSFTVFTETCSDHMTGALQDAQGRSAGSQVVCQIWENTLFRFISFKFQKKYFSLNVWVSLEWSHAFKSQAEKVPSSFFYIFRFNYFLNVL